MKGMKIGTVAAVMLVLVAFLFASCEQESPAPTGSVSIRAVDPMDSKTVTPAGDVDVSHYVFSLWDEKGRNEYSSGYVRSDGEFVASDLVAGRWYVSGEAYVFREAEGYVKVAESEPVEVSVRTGQTANVTIVFDSLIAEVSGDITVTLMLPLEDFPAQSNVYVLYGIDVEPDSGSWAEVVPLVVGEDGSTELDIPGEGILQGLHMLHVIVSDSDDPSHQTIVRRGADVMRLLPGVPATGKLSFPSFSFADEVGISVVDMVGDVIVPETADGKTSYSVDVVDGKAEFTVEFAEPLAPGLAVEWYADGEEVDADETVAAEGRYGFTFNAGRHTLLMIARDEFTALAAGSVLFNIEAIDVNIDVKKASIRFVDGLTDEVRALVTVEEMPGSNIEMPMGQTIGTISARLTYNGREDATTRWIDQSTGNIFDIENTPVTNDMTLAPDWNGYFYDEAEEQYEIYLYSGLLNWGKAADEGKPANAILLVDIDASVPTGSERSWKHICLLNDNEEYNIENPYQYVFDGDGHVISDLRFAPYEQLSGFICYVGEKGEIKNVVFDDVRNSSDFWGIVAGANDGLIENCHTSTYGTFTTAFSGGIARANLNNGTIRNCSSSARLTGGTFNGVGGIVSMNYGLIEGCRFSGYVRGSASLNDNVIAGGIAGDLRNGRITGCSLDPVGHVYSRGAGCGGIVGITRLGFAGAPGSFGDHVTEGPSSIDNCVSEGLVEGGDCTGGIIGNFSEPDCSIIDCIWTGSIKSRGSDVGGIAGAVYADDLTIAGNTASGTLVADNGEDIGGIIGGTYYDYQNISITGNRSVADITGVENVGGIIGQISGSNRNMTFASNYFGGTLNVSGDDSVDGAGVGGIVGTINFEAIGTFYGNLSNWDGIEASADDDYHVGAIAGVYSSKKMLQAGNVFHQEGGLAIPAVGLYDGSATEDNVGTIYEPNIPAEAATLLNNGILYFEPDNPDNVLWQENPADWDIPFAEAAMP